MTAETLKPFLATTSLLNASNGQKSLVVSMTNTDNVQQRNDIEGGVGGGSKRRKSARLFTFGAIVSICLVALIGVEIWQSMRSTRLQNEVHRLSSQLQALMRLNGLDHDIDLNELIDVFEQSEQKQPVRPAHRNPANTDDMYANYDVDDEDDDDDNNDDIDEDGTDWLDDEYGSGDIEESPMYLDEVPEHPRQRRSLAEESNFAASQNDEILQHIIPYQELSAEFPPEKHAEMDHSKRPKSRRNRVIASLNERMTKSPASRKKDQFMEAHSKKKAHGKMQGGSVRDMRLMRRSMNANPSGRRSTPTHPIAMHYVGHHTDADNGRRKHHGGVYQTWRPADWTSGSERYFHMSNGTVTVVEPGVYHVYAQICFDDRADEFSFRINHNERPLLQCVSTSITEHGATKTNSCYTAGMVYLQEGDRIHVHDVSRSHALVKPWQSYFGLFRVA